MTEDLTTRFRANCSRCQALCCVALHLKPEGGFPEEKAPGVPCRHIDRKRLNCGIWRVREAHGFTGCGPYDCFGAGQLVSKVMTKRGMKWPKLDPATADRCFDDMRRLMRIHLMLAYLHAGQVTDPPLLANLEAIVDSYTRTGFLPPADQVVRMLMAHNASVLRIFQTAAAAAGSAIPLG
ncbi:MAG TPA: hypothetical protein VGE72_11465 [Azospirillum sp.]